MKILSGSVNKKHQIKFYHVPKCAGTSINGSLVASGYDTGQADSVHSNHIGIDERPLDDFYFNICACRNPYDRLYSAWNYLRVGGGGGRRDRRFKKRLDGIEFDSFVHGLSRWRYRDYIHFLPMVHWTGSSIHQYDAVLRFESLLEDWDSLSMKLGSLEPLSHKRNMHRTDSFMDHYSPEMLSIVNEYYAADFVAFGYDLV